VPEIIDPVFAKTSQNARFLLSENERFGLVFVKTGSINSGTERQCFHGREGPRQVLHPVQHGRPLQCIICEAERCKTIFFKMFVKKVFQLVKPILANLHATISQKTHICTP
jgi:hypothetical protein